VSYLLRFSEMLSIGVLRMKSPMKVGLGLLGGVALVMLVSAAVYHANSWMSTVPSGPINSDAGPLNKKELPADQPSAGSTLRRIIELRITMVASQRGTILNVVDFLKSYLSNNSQLDPDKLKVIIDHKAFEAIGVKDIERKMFTLEACQDVPLGKLLREGLQEIGATYQVVSDSLKVVPAPPK